MSCVLYAVLACLLWAGAGRAEDVFASSAHMRIVARGERSMLQAVEIYLQQEQARLDNITSLLESVEEARARPSPSTANDEDEEGDFVGNPLNAFHLIRRFATTWRDVWVAVSNFQHYEALKSQAESFASFIPLEEDYVGALASLLRLQKMYLLPTRDLVAGQVAGGPRTTPAPAAPLSQRSCFDLGQAAVQQGEVARAREWFEAGRACRVEPLVPPAWILYSLAQIDASLGDIVSSSKHIEEAKKIDPLNLPQSPTPLPLHQVPREAEWQIKYRELCRRAVYQPDCRDPAASHLRCELRPSQVVPYMRHKVEWMHRGPDVQLFHDFVTEQESERLKTISTHMIQRAKVGRTVDAFVSGERVGKVAWLWDNHADSLIRRLSLRISGVTGLNMEYPAAEPLQTSNYGIGGHYEPHFDHDERRDSRTDIAPEVILSGDRIATFMIYLNKVKSGGATVFPKINMFANPVKNAAIFWHNYKQSGQGDSDTLHAGCPVLIGEKWVANKWIREFGQEFRRPCALTADL